MTNKKSGFTLVEILVVILIIGLLFVFLVPKIDNATDKARETGIKTDFRSYQTAFEAVAREKGGLGTKAFGLDDVSSYYAGSATQDNVGKVVEEINYYLDPALQLEVSDSDTKWTPDGTGVGSSVYHAQTKTKLDPWNNPYIVRWVSDKSSDNSNNGIITIGTKGKNGEEDATLPSGDIMESASACASACTGDNPCFGTKRGEDDYVMVTVAVDGGIYTGTEGFTTNIKAVG